MKKTRTKKKRGRTCSRILTPKQVGPLCWFMATFVAMFYSQRSRKKLIEASKNWDLNIPIFKIFKFILDNKYEKISSKEHKNYEYFYTEFVYFLILLFLNKINNIVFPYNPILHEKYGFSTEHYIAKLYNFLGINNRIYEYSTKQQILAYSHLNKEFDNIITPTFRFNPLNLSITRDINQYNYNNFKYVEPNNPPSILIIIIRDYDKDCHFYNYNQYLIKNIINDSKLKNTLISMDENITYLDVKYNLDSVLLTNWNTCSLGSHLIAGITCKKKHYVYNGWARSTIDPAMGTQLFQDYPCELMPLNWNIKENGDFCLDPVKCIPETLKRNLNKQDLCFNFSKGERVLIYVRKDTNTDPSSQSSSSHKNSHNDDKLSSPPLRPTSRRSPRYIPSHNDEKLSSPPLRRSSRRTPRDILSHNDDKLSSPPLRPTSRRTPRYIPSHNDEKLSSPPLRRSSRRTPNSTSRSSSTHNDNISPLSSIYEDFLSKKNKHKVTFAS